MRQPRHERIIQLVKQNGYMSIDALAREPTPIRSVRTQEQ